MCLHVKVQIQNSTNKRLQRNNSKGDQQKQQRGNNVQTLFGPILKYKEHHKNKNTRPEENPAIWAGQQNKLSV